MSCLMHAHVRYQFRVSSCLCLVSTVLTSLISLVLCFFPTNDNDGDEKHKHAQYSTSARTLECLFLEVFAMATGATPLHHITSHDYTQRPTRSIVRHVLQCNAMQCSKHPP